MSASRASSAGPQRTLRVLERIAASDVPPSQAQLSAALGIAKSTLSVLLADLRDLGYVRAIDRGYVPGPALVELGHTVTPSTIHSAALRESLRPILEELAGTTQETVVLSVEVGATNDRPGFVLAIDHIESQRPLRFVPPIGQPQPMYRTAAGRVFLAFSGRSAASLPPDSFVRLTNRTIVDPALVDAELELVRSRGYALNADETIEGVVTIAAPVFDERDQPVAAISVFGPSHRLTDVEETVWPHLQNLLATKSQLPSRGGCPPRLPQNRYG